MSRLPSFMIPHGGGPCFFMEPPPGLPHLWDGMAAHLRDLPAQIGRTPAALLVISAHWEAAVPTFTAGPSHSLLFDYTGFPPHTYQLTYPAPGAPAVAQAAASLLGHAGIASALDTERGLDHGVFIPLKLAYPQAAIPVVQLSLQLGLAPAAHLAIGRALAPLRDQDVVILGTGMTYHNMRDFNSPRATAASAAFDAWLAEVVALPGPDRDKALTRWAEAPGARYAHPREEHLLPLMVAAGAAGDDPGSQIYRELLADTNMQSGYRFG
jgi:aromatic ring-opening dioxygenase catalytic subunit (LigB family)